MIVAINGVVCSGKTTLCKSLEKIGFNVLYTSQHLPKPNGYSKLPAKLVVDKVEELLQDNRLYITDSFPYDIEQLKLTKLEIVKVYILTCSEETLRQRVKQRQREDDIYFEERLKYMTKDIEELKKEYKQRNISYTVLKNENIMDLILNTLKIMRELI